MRHVLLRIRCAKCISEHDIVNLILIMRFMKGEELFPSAWRKHPQPMPLHRDPICLFKAEIYGPRPEGLNDSVVHYEILQDEKVLLSLQKDGIHSIEYDENELLA